MQESSGVAGRGPFQRVRYSRPLPAAEDVVRAALVRTLEVLGHPLQEGAEAEGVMRFSMHGRRIAATIEDGDAGVCRVALEFTTLRWQGVGASAVVVLPGLLLGAALRAQDALLARTLLSNLERLLAGRPLARDPSRIPALTALWRRLDIPDAAAEAAGDQPPIKR